MEEEMAATVLGLHVLIKPQGFLFVKDMAKIREQCMQAAGLHIWIQNVEVSLSNNFRLLPLWFPQHPDHQLQNCLPYSGKMCPLYLCFAANWRNFSSSGNCSPDDAG